MKDDSPHAIEDDRHSEGAEWAPPPYLHATVAQQQTSAIPFGAAITGWSGVSVVLPTAYYSPMRLVPIAKPRNGKNKVRPGE